MQGVFSGESARNLAIENPNALGKTDERAEESQKSGLSYAPVRVTSYSSPKTNRGAPSAKRTSTTENPEGLAICSLLHRRAPSNCVCSILLLGSAYRCRCGCGWCCLVGGSQ